MRSEIISSNLPASAEFILSTNIKSPIVIIGVATSQIRDSKKDPWRTGYLVFYEESGCKKKAEINVKLYDALNLVFNTLGELDHPYWSDEFMLEGDKVND